MAASRCCNRRTSSPKWLAVLAREAPDTALRDLDDLQRVKWRIAEAPATYALAAALSWRLQHHLFDTLYHATALAMPEATFVTAYHVYFHKARREGRIDRLANFAVTSAPDSASQGRLIPHFQVW